MTPRRIAVFRALMLGDMLCAVPALRALRHAWPGAHVTLIGLAWAADWARRLSCVDDFVVFPGRAGLPETAPDESAWPTFVRSMRERRFDLLLQMHGSGAVVNPMLADFGAARTAGFVVPGAWCADRALHVAWPDRGHEIERLLALTDHLGVARAGTQLELAADDADGDALRSAWPAWGERDYVCVHAGARFASRRWPASRHAAVADSLAANGMQVVLTGSASERALVAEVERAMRHEAVNLAGRTTLWTLAALIRGGRLLVCNDTGVSHVAAATRTRSVVVSCGSDVARWAPLDRQRHRVLWQALACRPCAYETCPTRHECASGVAIAEVATAAQDLLAAAAWPEDRRVAV